MTDFSVAIKIDASQADAALRKVGGELDRVERATKQAEATIKKAVSEGTLHWTKAAEAQKALVGELVRVERAAERAAQQMSGGLNSVLDTVNSKVRQLTQFTGELGLAGNAIGGLVGGIASAASGFVSWHVQMLAINDQLIEMRNRLRNVTEGQTQLTFALANTRNIADRTLTSLDVSVDVYARMMNATKELGLSQQHVSRLTETLSKMFQASGRSAGETSAAMLQLSQALGSGVLQGDEFRSLAENAPQLLTVFSRELGVTRGELKKLASEGKITTDVMISGLDKMADSADRAFDRMEKTFAQKAKPLLTAMQADPLKLNKALTGNLGDADDIFKGAHKTGFFDGELATTLTGGYNDIKAGTGELADFGRVVVDLGEKLAKVSEEMAASGQRDPWAVAKPATLGFEMQLQQLIERVEKLNSPTMAADGAVMWKALGASVATFADNAANDLDGVLARLGMLVGSGSGDSAIKGVVDKFVEQAKKNASWDPAGSKFGAKGGAARKKKTDTWADTYVSSILDTLDVGLAEAKARLELFNQLRDRSINDLGAFTAAGVTGVGALAGGPSNLDIANDPNFLKPADDALSGRIDAEKNRQAYVLEQQTQQFREYERVATQSLSGVEDAFVRLFQTGEFGAKQMMDAIMAQFTRMATHSLFQGLIGAALGPGPNMKWANGQTSAYGLPHAASGGDWRIGGSSTVGDRVPFVAMVNSGETVSIRNQQQQAAAGGRAIVNIRNVVRDDPRALMDALDSPEGERIVNRFMMRRGRRAA